MPFAITTFPAGPYRFGDPDRPDLEFAATGATGPVQWSVDHGAMAPAVGASSILSPTNDTRTVTVTAKDTGTDPWTVVTKTLTVEAMFPVEASRDIESDVDFGLELSEAELGPPKIRLVQMSGQWPLEFRVRMYMDYSGVRDFLIRHRGLPFWYQDTYLGELVKGFQVSNLRRKPSFTNLLAYSFQFKAFNWNPPANIADVGPFKPAGAPPDFG